MAGNRTEGVGRGVNWGALQNIADIINRSGEFQANVISNIGQTIGGKIDRRQQEAQQQQYRLDLEQKQHDLAMERLVAGKELDMEMEGLKSAIRDGSDEVANKLASGDIEGARRIASALRSRAHSQLPRIAQQAASQYQGPYAPGVQPSLPENLFDLGGLSNQRPDTFVELKQASVPSINPNLPLALQAFSRAAGYITGDVSETVQGGFDQISSFVGGKLKDEKGQRILPSVDISGSRKPENVDFYLGKAYTELQNPDAFKGKQPKVRDMQALGKSLRETLADPLNWQGREWQAFPAANPAALAKIPELMSSLLGYASGDIDSLDQLESSFASAEESYTREKLEIEGKLAREKDSSKRDALGAQLRMLELEGSLVSNIRANSKGIIDSERISDEYAALGNKASMAAIEIDTLANKLAEYDPAVSETMRQKAMSEFNTGLNSIFAGMQDGTINRRDAAAHIDLLSSGLRGQLSAETSKVKELAAVGRETSTLIRSFIDDPLFEEVEKYVNFHKNASESRKQLTAQQRDSRIQRLTKKIENDLQGRSYEFLAAIARRDTSDKPDYHPESIAKNRAIAIINDMYAPRSGAK